MEEVTIESISEISLWDPLLGGLGWVVPYPLLGNILFFAIIIEAMCLLKRSSVFANIGTSLLFLYSTIAGGAFFAILAAHPFYGGDRMDVPSTYYAWSVGLLLLSCALFAYGMRQDYIQKKRKRYFARFPIFIIALFITVITMLIPFRTNMTMLANWESEIAVQPDFENTFPYKHWGTDWGEYSNGHHYRYSIQAVYNPSEMTYTSVYTFEDTEGKFFARNEVFSYDDMDHLEYDTRAYCEGSIEMMAESRGLSYHEINLRDAKSKEEMQRLIDEFKSP